MSFYQPTGWADALELRAEHPDAVPVAGGTDVLVEVNFGRLAPAALLDLGRVAGLGTSGSEDGWLRLGAGLTYTDLLARHAGTLPALAAAARTVGSPQIRNRGTVGGNLGSASPAGDCHPPLLAAGARLELASVRGTRTVPAAEFFVGPKRSVLAADELVAAVLVPRATGPQVFTKVGTRNAMVIAVCSFALVLDPPAGRVGTGIGSAGPVPLTAGAAERALAATLRDEGLWDSRERLPAEAADAFAEGVAAAAAPIDDVRGSARYRRHALSVLARRALDWAWQSYRESA